MGKSTIISELKKLDYLIVEEAAAKLIKTDLDLGIEEPQKTKGFDDRVVKFQNKNESNILQRIKEAVRPIVFYDRSQVDPAVYSLHFAGNISNAILKSVDRTFKETRYNKTVFVIDPLDSYELDGVRCEDQKTALVIQDMLEKSYAELGFKIVHVEKGSIEERVRFVLDYVSGIITYSL